MHAFTAESVYGMGPSTLTTAGLAAPTETMGVDDGPTGVRSLIDPKNPLVWFGGFLLATAGFAGIAGSVRLGPARLSGSVGKS
jgi:hypothetical protein